MSTVLKSVVEPLTEELVASLAGRFIHVPVNMVTVFDPAVNGEREHNVWFGGKVAGYEKAVLNMNYETDEFLDEPVTYWQILLADGMGYRLTTGGKLEILEITEEEYLELVAEHQAKVALAQEERKLLLPNEGNDKKIILPGEVN